MLLKASSTSAEPADLVAGIAAAISRLSLRETANKGLAEELVAVGWSETSSEDRMLQHLNRIVEVYRLIASRPSFAYLPNGESHGQDEVSARRIEGHIKRLTEPRSKTCGERLFEPFGHNSGTVSISAGQSLHIERSMTIDAILEDVKAWSLEQNANTMQAALQKHVTAATHNIIGQFTSDWHWVVKQTQQHRFLSGLSRVGVRDQSRVAAFAMIPANLGQAETESFAYFSCSLYERAL